MYIAAQVVKLSCDDLLSASVLQKFFDRFKKTQRQTGQQLLPIIFFHRRINWQINYTFLPFSPFDGHFLIKVSSSFLLQFWNKSSCHIVWTKVTFFSSAMSFKICNFVCHGTHSFSKQLLLLFRYMTKTHFEKRERKLWQIIVNFSHLQIRTRT